jgi:hypothetical protein
VERVGELLRQTLLSAMTAHAAKQKGAVASRPSELDVIAQELESLQHRRGLRLLNRLEQVHQRYFGGGEPILSALKSWEARVRRMGPS